jgi:hypothetical protein
MQFLKSLIENGFFEANRQKLHGKDEYPKSRAGVSSNLGREFQTPHPSAASTSADGVGHRA